MDMYTPVRPRFRGLKTDAEVFAFAQDPATSLEDLLEILDYTDDHQMFKMITERPEVKHWMRTHANAVVWFQNNRFFRTSFMDDVFLNPHMPTDMFNDLVRLSPGFNRERAIRIAQAPNIPLDTVWWLCDQYNHPTEIREVWERRSSELNLLRQRDVTRVMRILPSLRQPWTDGPNVVGQFIKANPILRDKTVFIWWFRHDPVPDCISDILPYFEGDPSMGFKPKDVRPPLEVIVRSPFSHILCEIFNIDVMDLLTVD